MTFDLRPTDNADPRVLDWDSHLFITSEVLDTFNPAGVIIQSEAQTLRHVALVHATELRNQLDEGHLGVLEHLYLTLVQ